MSSNYAEILAEALPDLQRVQEEKARQVLGLTLLNSYLSYKVDEWEIKEYLRLY